MVASSQKDQTVEPPGRQTGGFFLAGARLEASTIGVMSPTSYQTAPPRGVAEGWYVTVAPCTKVVSLPLPPVPQPR
jgi:hypothetical protein